MMEEAALLKQIALERYALDFGTMYECTDASGYADLIRRYGSAEAAWAAELELLEARRECGGYYEQA